MKNPPKNRCFSRGCMLRLTALGTAALCALWMPAPAGSRAFAVPPLHGTRSTPYPPAFCAYMEVRYGEYWMHTVQERIVRRMYVEWCLKHQEKPKPRDRKR